MFPGGPHTGENEGRFPEVSPPETNRIHIPTPSPLVSLSCPTTLPDGHHWVHFTDSEVWQRTEVARALKGQSQGTVPAATLKAQSILFLHPQVPPQWPVPLNVKDGSCWKPWVPAALTWEGGSWDLRPSLLQPLAAVGEGLLAGHVVDKTQDIGTLPLGKGDRMRTGH